MSRGEKTGYKWSQQAVFMKLGGSMIGRAGVSSDQWGEMSIADEAETDGGNGPAQYHTGNCVCTVRGTWAHTVQENAQPGGQPNWTRFFFSFLIPCVSCQQIGS